MVDESWNVTGVLTGVATGEVTGLSMGAVEVGSLPVADGMVITGKVWNVWVLLTVSVAVTVTFVRVFAEAPLALMWITPSGLVVDSVDEVMVIGLVG